MQPWLAYRCSIPGTTAADRYGYTGYDCKIAGASLRLGNAGKPLLRMTVLGRDYLQEANPSWSFANSEYDDPVSVPDIGNGFLKIDGTEYPIISAQINFVNSLTTPDAEMVIGSFRPDDFVALDRVMTINFVYKYAIADLSRLVYNNSASSTTWNPLPFIPNKDANSHAMELELLSPLQIGATGKYYGMRVRASKMAFTLAGTPQFTGGDFVTQAYTGIALAPDTGDEYAEFLLQNDVNAYA